MGRPRLTKSYTNLGNVAKHERDDFKKRGGGNDSNMRVRLDANGKASPTAKKATVEKLMKNNRLLARENGKLKNLFNKQKERLKWIRASTDDLYLKAVIEVMIKECDKIHN